VGEAEAEGLEVVVVVVVEEEGGSQEGVGINVLCGSSLSPNDFSRNPE